MGKSLKKETALQEWVKNYEDSLLIQRHRIDSLQLAVKELVWDNSHARFMATLPSTVEEGTTYTAPLHQVLRATYEGLSLRVNGTLIDSDMKPVTFIFKTISLSPKTFVPP